MRGVYLDRQLERVYPQRDLARGLLGNVQENRGRGGIEQEHEEVLRGQTGREIRARNSQGQLIPGKLIEVEPPLPGGKVVLTIDRDLQEIGHEALKEAIRETGAKGGDLLVTDPGTGEILAMVSIRDGASSALTAINTPYEPGSTLKPFTVAAILETGVGTLQDSVDTEEGRWTVAGRTIADVHAAGVITLSEALRESSNVGVAKVAERLTPAQQYESLRDFGFGAPTGIALPGEAGGTLRRPDQWSAQSPVSLAIGYEISVTPLQMAMAYGALANGGDLMEPQLVREVRGPSEEILWKMEPRRVRTVLSERTTRQIARVMVEVVEDGTGTAARLSSFAIAGKSGTSRAYGPGGYESGNYYSSFVGFFPADEPQLVVYVKLEKPQGEYYGGATAAPVTRATMQAVLAAGRSPLDRRALVTATSTPIRRPYLPTARFASQPLYSAPNRASGPNTGGETVGMVAQVPSVEGLPARVAARRLHALGYRVLFESPGTVRRTIPPTGEYLAAGDTIRLEARGGDDG
jgi:cell division protein FtsI (penicillin-binding protein 3)